MNDRHPKRGEKEEIYSQLDAAGRIIGYLTKWNRMTLPFVNLMGKYNRIISWH
jgi:hypothetical protein